MSACAAFSIQIHSYPYLKGDLDEEIQRPYRRCGLSGAFVLLCRFLLMQMLENWDKKVALITPLALPEQFHLVKQSIFHPVEVTEFSTMAVACE